LTLLHTYCAFLGLGDEECSHCEDCTLVSGSYLYTHVSSPVITVFRNPGSPLAHSSMSHATSRQSCCSCESSLATNFVTTLHMCKSFVTIECAKPVLIPTSSAIFRTVKRQSCRIRECTFSMTFAF
jgi:hypothetical protein